MAEKARPTQPQPLEGERTLSHNAHWAFDRGLWSVDDNHNILIKDAHFQEWGPNEVRLAGYRGRKLQFAAAATLRPDVEYFRRHRDRWRF